MGRGTVNTPPPTDKTLSVKGMAADAYETGEKFSQLSSEIETINETLAGFTNAAEVAL